MGTLKLIHLFSILGNLKMEWKILVTCAKEKGCKNNPHLINHVNRVVSR